jgi:hypothetical protein
MSIFQVAYEYNRREEIREQQIREFNQSIRKKNVIISKTDECVICLEKLFSEDILVTICGHFFHKKCMETVTICPLCRDSIYKGLERAL